MNIRRKVSCLVLFVLSITVAFISPNSTLAEDKTTRPTKKKEYQLTIDYKVEKFEGSDVKMMAINNSIPGPTLRFKIGDVARITVKNNMDVETSIHWHGLLLPNKQDGVPYLTTPPIQPGASYTYEFPIVHSGTYWYHSHTGLQEQRGMYGSIVVEAEKKRVDYDREHVVVLSDWTKENPDDILKALKSGSEYYSLKKGSMQSVWGAYKANSLKNYWLRELVSMPPMDLSDVAYDKFLANGQESITLDAKPGEKILLRFINAGASSYFYLQYGGGPMSIVASDGVDVKPVVTDRFLMAIAETYDVIVTVPPTGSYEFRATAQDGSGHSSIFIGQGKKILAPDVPQPDLYRLMHMAHSQSKGKKMEMEKGRPLPPYSLLKAVRSTVLPKSKKTREITLMLSGDMVRYVWSFNNKTLSEADKILISKSENLRINFVNKTMMHHPIHLHGHFFRVLNAHGDYSPLKHTVDIPPLGKQTIEFEGNATKDWFMHCHILYHAKAGMARIVSYTDSEIDDYIKTIRGALLADPWDYFGEVSILSNMSNGGLYYSNTRNTFAANYDIGWRDVDGTEHEADITYNRYFNRFFTAFAGINISEETDRGIAGVNVLIPFNIDSTIWIDDRAEFRFGVEKEIQLTDRLALLGETSFDTEERWEGMVGLAWTLDKNFDVVAQWHSDYSFGAGVRVRF